MTRFILRGLTILSIIVAIIVLAAMSYRAYRQHQISNLLAIRSANGILEAGFVPIGGIQQWVQIRGESRDNPAILFVHGGPGISAIPLSNEAFHSWETAFTVVHWDQRGAGRTYIQSGRSGERMPKLEQIIQDGIEVAEYVRARLHKTKLILIGASWGSVVGIEMVRRRPDLFVAYVGTGQVVNMERNEAVGYRRLMERLHAAGDQRAIERLQQIGPPPYEKLALMGAERQILMAHAPPSEKNLLLSVALAVTFAPGYSLRDAYDVGSAAFSTRLDPLYAEFMGYDMTRSGTIFEVPMFFIQGADDIQTPTELVQEVFPSLTAPRKELVLVPGGGHSVVFALSTKFLEVLVSRVRPLAMPKDG